MNKFNIADSTMRMINKLIKQQELMDAEIVKLHSLFYGIEKFAFDFGNLLTV